MTKTPIRRRITPSFPYVLAWTDADGKETSSAFRLSYDFNAFAQVEQELPGVNTLLVGTLFAIPSATSTRVLFWAALQENHPEYAGKEGLSAVGSMLTLVNWRDANEACAEAYLLQLPEDVVKKLKAEQSKRLAADAEGKEPEPPLASSPALSHE